MGWKTRPALSILGHRETASTWTPSVALSPYVCCDCTFKGTYEEMADSHLPDSLCHCHGVTCEREDMEDNMKMCRLEEMA